MLSDISSCRTHADSGLGRNNIYWSHKQSTTFLQWSTYYSLDVHLSSDDDNCNAAQPRSTALRYHNPLVRFRRTNRPLLFNDVSPLPYSTNLQPVTENNITCLRKSTFLLSNSRRYTQYKTGNVRITQYWDKFDLWILDPPQTVIQFNPLRSHFVTVNNFAHIT